MTQPTSLTMRTYQVGFGDCFLLTFHYAKSADDRHVLIDFGSTRAPEKLLKKLPAALPPYLKSKYSKLKPPVTSAKLMEMVANDIAVNTAGKLHVVVATHRHKDHISGFATNKKGTASGDIIRSLNPDLVVMPWTEHPDAETDATKPPSTIDRQRTKAFASSLAGMNSFAGAVEEEALRLIDLRKAASQKSTPSLNVMQFLGENNVANKSAIENLMTMGKKTAYVNFGSSAGKKAIKSVLPGVTTHILGPPTLIQSDAIRNQKSKDKDEFWHLAAAAASRFVAGSAQLFPKETTSAVPAHALWLTKRLDKIRLKSMNSLVRVLDNAMNNTSVILLFEAGKGKKKFLFPGDAQIENWSYALFAAPKKERDRIRNLLADVDLYKVGHHGSLNATPKTLWGLFEHRCSTPDGHSDNHVHDEEKERISTVVSTLSGVHGKTKETQVPRSTLITALKNESDLQNTNGISQFCFTKSFKLS